MRIGGQLDCNTNANIDIVENAKGRSTMEPATNKQSFSADVFERNRFLSSLRLTFHWRALATDYKSQGSCITRYSVVPEDCGSPIVHDAWMPTRQEHNTVGPRQVSSRRSLNYLMLHSTGPICDRKKDHIHQA